MSSNEKHKVHNFSLLAAVGGFSYICAILMGDLFSQFSPSFPFWIASILGIINVSLLLIFFQETHHIKSTAPFGFWKIVQAFGRLFTNRQLNFLYLCFFFS